MAGRSGSRSPQRINWLAIARRGSRAQSRCREVQPRAWRSRDAGRSRVEVRPTGREARCGSGTAVRRGTLAADRRRSTQTQADTRNRRGPALGREHTSRYASSSSNEATNRTVISERVRCCMKATCWMGKRKIVVEDVPDPSLLNSRDAIVRVTSTAICGSDLHLYNGFVPTMEKGDVLGHEFMGEVVEVGKGVDNLRVGDRVVVPFPIACGDCGSCQAGAYSLCENSNPNAWMAEKLWGHAPCGIYG